MREIKGNDGEKGEGARWKARRVTLTLLAKSYAGALHVMLACDIFLRIS